MDSDSVARALLVTGVTYITAGSLTLTLGTVFAVVEPRPPSLTVWAMAIVSGLCSIVAGGLLSSLSCYQRSKLPVTPQCIALIAGVSVVTISTNVTLMTIACFRTIYANEPWREIHIFFVASGGMELLVLVISSLLLLRCTDKELHSMPAKRRRCQYSLEVDAQDNYGFIGDSEVWCSSRPPRGNGTNPAAENLAQTTDQLDGSVSILSHHNGHYVASDHHPRYIDPPSSDGNSSNRLPARGATERPRTKPPPIPQRGKPPHPLPHTGRITPSSQQGKRAVWQKGSDDAFLPQTLALRRESLTRNVFSAKDFPRPNTSRSEGSGQMPGSRGKIVNGIILGVNSEPPREVYVTWREEDDEVRSKNSPEGQQPDPHESGLSPPRPPSRHSRPPTSLSHGIPEWFYVLKRNNGSQTTPPSTTSEQLKSLPDFNSPKADSPKTATNSGRKSPVVLRPLPRRIIDKAALVNDTDSGFDLRYDRENEMFPLRRSIFAHNLPGVSADNLHSLHNGSVSHSPVHRSISDGVILSPSATQDQYQNEARYTGHYEMNRLTDFHNNYNNALDNDHRIFTVAEATRRIDNDDDANSNEPVVFQEAQV